MSSSTTALGVKRIRQALLLLAMLLALSACALSTPKAQMATRLPTATMTWQTPSATAALIAAEAETAMEVATTPAPTATPSSTATATQNRTPRVTPSATATAMVATIEATPTSTSQETETTAGAPASATPAASSPAPTILPSATPEIAPAIGTATVTVTPPPPSGGQSAPYELSPAVVGASGSSVHETSVTIPTYGYEAGFIPTAEDDAVYPYPRLDFARVSGPAGRSYKAIVLENGFVSVTVLPELGGRIYSFRDKATGRELLYQNPVIKPTSWGYRGWWLAAGGIEWAFPVEEHGLNEWRPWEYSIGSTAYGTAVFVSNREDRTGMEVGASISLDGGHSYVTIQPWARNATEQAQPYQLWLNGMITLGNNSVSGETEFIAPAGEVIIHSTGDGGLPGSGATISWPFYNGRDLGRYGNWDGYLGFFVPAGGGFSGLYDHGSGQGLVRAHAPNWPSGTKFFGPGSLSPSLWTDDNSNYVEMWSGATGSFWHSATLNPGETVTWTEHWYPIQNTGGFNYANRMAAIKLQETGTGADVAIATSGYMSLTAQLFANANAVAEWSVAISPSQAFRASWTRQPGQEGPLGLRLLGADGQLVAETGQMP